MACPGKVERTEGVAHLPILISFLFCEIGIYLLSIIFYHMVRRANHESTRLGQTAL